MRSKPNGETLPVDLPVVDVKTLDADQVSRFLMDLAEKDFRIQARIMALSLSRDPVALAGQLGERLDRFRETPGELGYRDLHPLARDFRAFLSDVHLLLAPVDPGVAFDLVDRFFELDALLDGAEEGGGPLQDVFREACSLWLVLAAESGIETDWASRIWEHYQSDRFGVRTDLLRGADLVVEKEALSSLAKRMLAELPEADSDPTTFDWQRYRAASGLRAIARALRDADLVARSMTLLQPEPNPRQIAEIVQAYLDYQGPESALQWLTGDWGEREAERLDLLDQVYTALDDDEMLFEIRREQYALNPTADHLDALLVVCEMEDRQAFLAAVPETARCAPSLYSGVNLLLSVDLSMDAETLVLERMDQLRSYDYTALLRLVGKFRNFGCRLALVACYRALLDDILEESQFRAYGKGAEYLRELERLDRRIDTYDPLYPHSVYESRIREQHVRKRAFWQRIDGEN